MYVPPYAREDRLSVLQDAVARIAFGTLVTFGDGALQATHLPMLLDPRIGPNGTLLGHVARNNPQWRSVDSAVAALATFIGPNFYVTPSWYATKTATGKVVPTWNYIAVQARGSVEFFDDRDRKLRLVDRLTRHHESRRERPWSVDDAPESYIEAMLGAIIGFTLSITSLEGAWKLGQQKPEADRAGVAAGIAAETSDPAIPLLLQHAASSLIP